MDIITTNAKKQYSAPQMKVCMIETCGIIAQSDEDPEEIYPNLRG